MSSSSGEYTTAASEKKYKGIRRRKWGKWVSEIRVPGTPDRLWLGSYATPEAAAVAHDVASYCLRENSSTQNLNFPELLPAAVRTAGMSPRSVQKAASDAGLAIDARLVGSKKDGEKKKESDLGGEQSSKRNGSWESESSGWPREEYLDISVDDYL